ncbi:MAG: hypothetical protein PHZ19_11390 [Candidatus Thermoplasmatota archaeon]|nr:hypothetical protein [Candidatus Thermoplasmatota archaeon]
MLVLFDENGAVIDIIPGGVVKGKNVFVGGIEVAGGVNCRWAVVPEQDVSRLRVADELGSTGWRGQFPEDFILYTPEEQDALVDRETCQAINAQIHPFAPIEEQIGIIRTQLVSVMNAIGIKATPEFTKFNEIAMAEIEKGTAKKVALHDA